MEILEPWPPVWSLQQRLQSADYVYEAVGHEEEEIHHGSDVIDTADQHSAFCDQSTDQKRPEGFVTFGQRAEDAKKWDDVVFRDRLQQPRGT